MIINCDKNDINISRSILSIWAREEIIFLSLLVTSKLFSWSAICDRIIKKKLINRLFLTPMGEWVIIISLKLCDSIEPLLLYNFCYFQQNSLSQSHLIAIFINFIILPIRYTIYPFNSSVGNVLSDHLLWQKWNKPMKEHLVYLF